MVTFLVGGSHHDINGGIHGHFFVTELRAEHTCHTKKLGIHRETVIKHLESGAFPSNRKTYQQASLLDPYRQVNRLKLLQ